MSSLLKSKIKKWFWGFNIVIIALLAANAYLYISKKNQSYEIDLLSQEKEILKEKVMSLEKDMLNLNINQLAVDSVVVLQNIALTNKIETLRALLLKADDKWSAKFEHYKQETLRLENEVGLYKKKVQQLDDSNKQLIADNSELQTGLEQRDDSISVLQIEKDLLVQRVKKMETIQIESLVVQGMEKKKKDTYEPTAKAKQVSKILAEFSIPSTSFAPEGEYLFYMQVVNSTGSVINSKAGTVNGSDIKYSAKDLIYYSKQNNKYALSFSDLKDIEPGFYTVNLYSKSGVLGSSSLQLR